MWCVNPCTHSADTILRRISQHPRSHDLTPPPLQMASPMAPPSGEGLSRPRSPLYPGTYASRAGAESYPDLSPQRYGYTLPPFGCTLTQYLYSYWLTTPQWIQA